MNTTITTPLSTDPARAADRLADRTAAELRRRTEDFLTTAPLAEQRLLVDVLTRWQVRPGMGLLAAFEQLTGAATPQGLTAELDGTLALVAACLIGLSPRVQQTAAATLAENCPELLAASLRDRLPTAESESLRELAYQVAGITNQARATRQQRLQGPWDAEQVDALVDEAIGPRVSPEAVE